MRKRHVMIWADAVRAVALASLPAARDVRPSADLAHVRRRARHGRRDGVLRRVEPELHPVAGAHRPDRRGERQAPVHRAARRTSPDRRPAGWLDRGARRAARDPHRRAAPTSRRSSRWCSRSDHEKLRAPEDRAPLLQGDRRGLRWVFGNPLLRRIVGTTGVANFFNTIIDDPAADLRAARTRLDPRHVRHRLLVLGGRRPRSARSRRRASWRASARPARSRSARSASASCPSSCPRSHWCRPSHSHSWSCNFFLGSFMVLLYNITQVTFRQRITPPRLLGRMKPRCASSCGASCRSRRCSPARSAPGSAWSRRCGSRAFGQLFSVPVRRDRPVLDACANCPTPTRTTHRRRRTTPDIQDALRDRLAAWRPGSQPARA